MKRPNESGVDRREIPTRVARGAGAMTAAQAKQPRSFRNAHPRGGAFVAGQAPFPRYAGINGPYAHALAKARAMSPNVGGVLKIGSGATIFALGALLVAQSPAGLLGHGCVVLMIGLSWLGMAVSGRAPLAAAPASAASADAAAAAKDNAARQESNNSIDAALDHVVSLIKGYLAAHRTYQADLAGLNKGLSEASTRIDVQQVLIRLISSNMDMQAKVVGLSKDLEASQQQIASLRRNVEEVGKIALIDELTELGNRRFFKQSLQDEIMRAHDTGAALCLAISDLDRFKAVNDRFGHVVGDHLLKLFAELLKRNMRGRGQAARYGGEEFTMLFPNAEIEEVHRIVEAIRRELESKRWVVGPKAEKLGAVTASFGIARLASDESYDSFVRRADAKLLEAKTAGRNRIAIDDPDTEVRPLSTVARAS
jgi:diguanylate cyclase